LVNERNGKEFYREFGEYMCRMLQNRQMSEGSFPLPLSSTMSPRKSTRGNPPPPLTKDTVNRMIQESVEAAIRAERERVQNEAIRAKGPNAAPVAREWMVPTEQKKVEAYIHGLSENIKGEVTSSEPATLNKAMWMAHTLMEQK
nr:hypothetical protein [Tanacetum cinerariifolium]